MHARVCIVCVHTDTYECMCSAYHPYVVHAYTRILLLETHRPPALCVDGDDVAAGGEPGVVAAGRGPGVLDLEPVRREGRPPSLLSTGREGLVVWSRLRRVRGCEWLARDCADRPPYSKAGGLLPAPWLEVISKVVGVGSFDVHGGSRQVVVGATDEGKRMDVDAC